MRLFFILFLFSLSLYASAQSKQTATTQQGITFKLLPVSVIKRDSAFSANTGTTINEPSSTPHTKEKWAIQLKRIAEIDAPSYAVLTSTATNHDLNKNLSDIQLYTISKP